MARSTKSRKIDLKEALSQLSFHNALFCTYTFDPLFFENYCLERLGALATNNNISILIDRRQYHKIIFAPESSRPMKVNLRYLLHPISVGGRFHPKVFFFSNATSGRLIIGSANFSRAGLLSNAELVDVFDFEIDRAEEFLPIFRDAFGFCSSLAERWPSESLSSNVAELLRNTPWLNKIPTTTDSSIRFIHNLEQSLWSQITDLIPRPLKRIYIVSRFFDETPVLLDRVMKQWQPEKLYIYTQNGITTLTADWLKHSTVRSETAEILLTTYEDEGHRQPLHAKLIAFESAHATTLVYGSANFTSPALLTKGSTGNVETMIAVRNVSPRKLSLLHLCDPTQSSYRLNSPEELNTAHRDEEPPQELTTPIRLVEAVLDGDNLTLHVEIAPDTALETLVAQLQGRGSRTLLLPVSPLTPDKALAKVPEANLARLQETSCTVSLIRRKDSVLMSNVIFLTNLLDIDSQQSVRRERHIREATQSANHFLSVLNDLLRGSDESALLTFLNFCDIPLLNAPRPPSVKGRPVWEGRHGMRSLGERNLKVCLALHQATLNFLDRHFRKLKRHIESPLLDGIANFLQIFLSMGNLLRMQLERTCIGLEAKSGNVSAEEWYECRKLWDVYLARFKELMECLWDNYVEQMSAQYKRTDLLSEFGQDLDAIHELCDEMISYRQRIENVRRTKCIRTAPDGTTTTYAYFHCIFSPESWFHYTNEVQSREQRLEFSLMGSNIHSLPRIELNSN